MNSAPIAATVTSNSIEKWRMRSAWNARQAMSEPATKAAASMDAAQSPRRPNP